MKSAEHCCATSSSSESRSVRCLNGRVMGVTRNDAPRRAFWGGRASSGRMFGERALAPTRPPLEQRCRAFGFRFYPSPRPTCTASERSFTLTAKLLQNWSPRQVNTLILRSEVWALPRKRPIRHMHISTPSDAALKDATVHQSGVLPVRGATLTPHLRERFHLLLRQFAVQRGRILASLNGVLRARDGDRALV